MEGLILIGATARLRAVIVSCLGLALLALSCYLLLGCDRPVRQWSGRPAEEFASDREACWQTSMEFEECMKGKSWKIYEGEQ